MSPSEEDQPEPEEDQSPEEKSPENHCPSDQPESDELEEDELDEDELEEVQPSSEDQPDPDEDQSPPEPMSFAMAAAVMHKMKAKARCIVILLLSQVWNKVISLTHNYGDHKCATG